jgi:hypothetical protein
MEPPVPVAGIALLVVGVAASKYGSLLNQHHVILNRIV